MKEDATQRHSTSQVDGAGSDPAPSPGAQSEYDGASTARPRNSSGVDSGEIETLADGSVSIPLLEEELIVTKRVVVRERIIVRKNVITERRRIDAELRRERVEADDNAVDGGARPRPDDAR